MRSSLFAGSIAQDGLWNDASGRLTGQPNIQPKVRRVPRKTLLSSSVPRRSFVRFASATTVAACAGALPAARTVRPSEQIHLGVIGLGSRGFNLLDDFLKLPDCRIVAICDVDEFHYRDRPWGKGRPFGRRPAEQHIQTAYARPKSGAASKGLRVYSDYRELLAGDDLDAIVVATPDHWHALCTYEALQSGRDVYCEKPVTHLFAEGRTIVEEVAAQDAVFQTGSQQRSNPLYHRAVELVRNGILGRLQRVEVGLPPGYDRPQGSTEIVSPRPTHDYDFWCGPAPVLPLMQARHHRWWRGHRAWGGGVLMDWIGHDNDIAHWAMGVDRSGPLTVEATDWVFPETSIYNTPQSFTIRCEYPGRITSSISSSHRQGLKLTGSEGWVFVRRGRIEASDKRWLEKDFRPGSWQVQKTGTHAANFLSCIRSRQECVAPADVGHRSITPGHLGYVSWALQKPLSWDAETETITNDEAAGELLAEVEYRQPWQVPGRRRPTVA